MEYSLLPGTNQLIYKHPDQGEALFKRHGYNIQRPNHRHYYNALRTGGYNGGFFQDLLAVLGGVSRSGIFDKTGSNSRSTLGGLGNETRDSIANLGTGSIGSPATPSFVTTIPGIGYDGTETDGEESDYKGPHTVKRQYYQFQELLSHLGAYGPQTPPPAPYYDFPQYQRYPYRGLPYPALVPIGAGTWTPQMQALANQSYADRDAAIGGGLGSQQDLSTLPPDPDFIATHLKGIAIAVVIIILVLYFKMR